MTDKKRSWWFRLKAWWHVCVNDWPVYRVDYVDGNRTRLLGKREAKSCAEVFHGRVYIDWNAMYRYMDDWA
jgi:hypothetical protein